MQEEGQFFVAFGDVTVVDFGNLPLGFLVLGSSREASNSAESVVEGAVADELVVAVLAITRSLITAAVLNSFLISLGEICSSFFGS